MAQAFSDDLRQRVLADYQGGMKFAPISRKYSVSAEWVWQFIRSSGLGCNNNYHLHCGIEMVFAKFKHEMRTRQPRTKPECDQLCGECLAWFSPAECENYLRHAGYKPQESI